jgi:hypothetical protein
LERGGYLAGEAQECCNQKGGWRMDGLFPAERKSSRRMQMLVAMSGL